MFVEGYTEANYFKKLRKNNNVEIAYKEINMEGGGYIDSNLMHEILEAMVECRILTVKKDKRPYVYSLSKPQQSQS